MSVVTYKPIGIVESTIRVPLPPEEIRAVESRLVLEPQFASAIAAIKEGQLLLIIYHLHQSKEWHDCYMTELFTRRTACRPNPIGVTLAQVIALSDSTVTVIGLDAINGSPILDIKPYKPIFDNPSVYNRVPES